MQGVLHRKTLNELGQSEIESCPIHRSIDFNALKEDFGISIGVLISIHDVATNSSNEIGDCGHDAWLVRTLQRED
jgi:hypothetical protein